MPSDPTFAYPPVVHHTAHSLPPPSASPQLASYLEKSLTRPYLHPDAWLSLEGVRHGPKSGPQGSWALHHLRRIEAGMRGELLAVESTEELVERFGEEVVGEATGVRVFGRKVEEEEEEDNTAVGGENTTAKVPKAKTKTVAEKPEHLMTKAEKKKARRAAEKAEIAAARAKGEEVPSFGKKRKRGSEVAHSEFSEQDNNTTPPPTAAADINDPAQYIPADTYAQEQREELADVGDRDPAGVDREDAVKAPVVVKHDAEGEVVVPKKRKGGEEEKEARRAAKKARRAEERAKKEEERSGGNAKMKVKDDVNMQDVDVKMEDVPVKMEDAADPVTPSAVGKLSRKEKKKLRDQTNGTTTTTTITPNGVNGTPAATDKTKSSKQATPQSNGTHIAEEKKSAKKKAKKAKSEKTS